MKKFTSFLIAFAILASLSIPSFAQTADKLDIVCTTFPQYDWVMNVLGDRAADANVTMLLQNGVDLHSYQPTASDIAKISACDLFIYVGGESDAWVDDVLAVAANPNLAAISMLASVEAKEEEIVDGMENGDHDHGDEDFAEADVTDRALTDFAGDWQSIYPFLADGSLAEMIEHNAEEKGMTEEEAFAFYENGFKTDVDRIAIDGDTITFYSGDSSVSAQYEAAGFQILTADDGSLSVRYQYEAAGDASGAPRYVQFGDHGHESKKAEHFHIYFGDESFEALLSTDKFFTYFPSAMTGAEIAEEMLAHGHSHDEEEVEYDEHVWLSLRFAQTITQAIADKLAALDPDGAERYQANAAAYIAQLSDLDARYQAMVDSAARKTVLFADRFPFRYLADDYGLSYYAAFVGCSAETEASFETVAFLAGKVDELSLPVVLVIEGATHKIAETVVSETKANHAQILVLNSLQSVTGEDVAGGETYLDVMEDNLVTLTQALN